MKIKEVHDIIIEKYPYYETLNKKLIQDAAISKYYPSHPVVKAKHSDYQTSSDSIKRILSFISKLIPREYTSQVVESWFAIYDKEEFTLTHRHRPASFGFVYFIQCPRGSSPLVFSTSGKRVKAEEGKVVIFPGNIYHHVPKNKCNGRIVLSGNIIHKQE